MGLALFKDNLNVIDDKEMTFKGKTRVHILIPTQFQSQRFLLKGRPQIGKTGTYFHFIEILHQFLKGNVLPSATEETLDNTMTYPEAPIGKESVGIILLDSCLGEGNILKSHLHSRRELRAVHC